MHVSSAIQIDAPAQTIYSLAEDVARWPQYLPHYRSVHVLEHGERERVVHMAARRDMIPVSWTARQRLFPDAPRIEFTHVGGWTKGMEVAWTFERSGRGTRVSIVHDLKFTAVPLLGDWIARRIIGEFFVQAIAAKTLARFKQIAEAQRG